MSYVQYAWAASQISSEDMATMYRHKKKVRKPITVQVKEAVALYVKSVIEISEHVHSHSEEI